MNILIIIGASFVLALSITISNIYIKIKDITNNQEKFEEKFIRDKELEDIRLDLKEIKREVFKRK